MKEPQEKGESELHLPVFIFNYLMGHNDRERRRLALQASILNPFY